MREASIRSGLDRMMVEEAGPDPARIAAAIHRQLSNVREGPVPIHAIAYALDIIEIRDDTATGFEGALVMPPDRNMGAIAVNGASNPRRRRFTIAHELGHFLCVHHQPVEKGQFTCSRADLGLGWASGSFAKDRHRRQEAEANRFAIELLAPHYRLKRALVGVPDLAKVIALAQDLDISREAMARRYAELHGVPTALTFSREGTLRYIERSDGFPYVGLVPGKSMPDLPQPSGRDGLSDHEAADPRDWSISRTTASLVAQTLYQADGYAITLLALDPDDEAENA